MAEFDFNELMFEKCIDGAVLAGANVFHQESLKEVPRDWEKPPNPIVLKTKSIPERNVRKGNKHYYRNPVSKNGQWYEGVTGNLKRSVGLENTGYLEYSVGVMEGPTEEYGYTHEFGDPKRSIPARSFLRKPLEKNSKKILDQMQKTFGELLDKYG